SILASKPFTFLVGENKRKFTVHAALVAYHSRPLGAVVNKHLLEAKVSCLLEDVDEDTFVRFAQYAYTGDYLSANPEIVLEKVQDDTPQQNIEDATQNRSPCVLFDKATVIEIPETASSKSKKKQLWEEFTGHNYIMPSPPQARRKQQPYHNYTEVFLCHARIYMFAEKYRIGPLKALSLHKLQQILIRYVIYKDRIEDIVSLLRYSYSRPVSQGSVNSLGLLVTHYAACVVEELGKSHLFHLALKESGLLGWDIMKQVLKRVL
ncbi:hypothetical protein K432DRAFT_308732, partial [Lepidopterella palustris CBS 459.81]